MTNALCHPDDISYHHMPSGWLSWRHLIWMSYCNVIMSSGWHALPLLSHADDVAFFFTTCCGPSTRPYERSLWENHYRKLRWNFVPTHSTLADRWKFNRRNIYHVHVLQSRAFLTLKCVNHLSWNLNALINMLSRTWCDEATIQDWSVPAFPTTCAISVFGYDNKIMIWMYFTLP